MSVHGFKSFFLLGFAVFVFPIFFSCKKIKEMSLEEIELVRIQNENELISKTITKPHKGEGFVKGKVGGVWNDTILNEPKTFNQLIGERDGQSFAIISNTLDYLCDYDKWAKKWNGRIADYEIEVNEEKKNLTVHWKIRDDAFWSFYESERKIPVTSDDFVFWYNEIVGDEAFKSSGYPQQFLKMEDGSVAHVDCIKIDEKRFDFIFPRIVSEPLLSCNMTMCPSFIFKKAKESGGVQGVMDLFSIDCDVKNIPSCGKFFISEYVPGQRICFERNPDYWEKDEDGVSIPYFEKMVCRIIGDQNTDFLLFKEGKTETYSPRPEELAEVVDSQDSGWTVFNSEGALTASFWSFNQNPVNKDSAFYEWFCKKEFRQAMSCLLNRNRIIKQTYRGLAQPKYDFFPECNAFYNKDIELDFKYDLKRALELLKKVGFYQDDEGILFDEKNRRVEFDLTINSSASIFNDIALILMDELSKVGIKLNIRQTDFQKIIEMLTSTYDWQSVFIGFGASLFPSQGSNVWPSNGNLHLWHPLQKEASTEWEKRIDYLYNEGNYTIEREKAKEIWDEYQSIILEQCPIIYLVRPRSFFAIRSKWNLDNVYFDNANGSVTEWIFLK